MMGIKFIPEEYIKQDTRTSRKHKTQKTTNVYKRVLHQSPIQMFYIHSSERHTNTKDNHMFKKTKTYNIQATWILCL